MLIRQLVTFISTNEASLEDDLLYLLSAFGSLLVVLA